VGPVAQSVYRLITGWTVRDRDFPPVQTGPGAHTASCKMGTESFPGVKCGRSVVLTTHSLLVPRSWKSTAIPLPTLWATPGLYRDHFNFYFIIYLRKLLTLLDNTRFTICTTSLPVPGQIAVFFVTNQQQITV